MLAGVDDGIELLQELIIAGFENLGGDYRTHADRALFQIEAREWVTASAVVTSDLAAANPGPVSEVMGDAEQAAHVAGEYSRVDDLCFETELERDVRNAISIVAEQFGGIIEAG